MYCFYILLVLAQPPYFFPSYDSENVPNWLENTRMNFSEDIAKLMMEIMEILQKSGDFIDSNNYRFYIERILNSENKNLDIDFETIARYVDVFAYKLEKYKRKFDGDKLLIEKNINLFKGLYGIDKSNDIFERLNVLKNLSCEILSSIYFISFRNANDSFLDKKNPIYKKKEQLHILCKRLDTALFEYECLRVSEYVNSDFIHLCYNIFKNSIDVSEKIEPSNISKKLNFIIYQEGSNLGNIKAEFQKSIGIIDDFKVFHRISKLLQNLFNEFSSKYENVAKFEKNLVSEVEMHLNSQDSTVNFSKILSDFLKKESFDEKTLFLSEINIIDSVGSDLPDNTIKREMIELSNAVFEQIKNINQRTTQDYKDFTNILNKHLKSTESKNRYIYEENFLFLFKTFLCNFKRQGFREIIKININIHKFLHNIEILAISLYEIDTTIILNQEKITERLWSVKKRLEILIEVIKKIQRDNFLEHTETRSVIFKSTRSAEEFMFDVSKLSCLSNLYKNELFFITNLKETDSLKKCNDVIQEIIEKGEFFDSDEYDSWYKSFLRGQFLAEINEKKIAIFAYFEDIYVSLMHREQYLWRRYKKNPYTSDKNIFSGFNSFFFKFSGNRKV